MTLLWLALAYLFGIALGHSLWTAGLVGCGFPGSLWLATLAALPLTPLLHKLPPFAPTRETLAAMRWPARFGFRLPRPNPTPALLAAVLLSLLTGTLRYASHPLTPCWSTGDLATYNLPAEQAFDRDAPMVTLHGYVNSYPLVSDARQRLHVRVESLARDGEVLDVRGDVRLNTGTRERYVYGQPVTVRGRLVTPPVFEDFSYRDYLARKGVHSLVYGAQIDVLPGPTRGSVLNRALYQFRARGEAFLNRALPEPYAALANGMLLGIEAGIPDELYEQFNLTGTSHVIVISGSNVALIAGVILALSQRVMGRRNRRVIGPTLLGIAAYALLVGGDAAVLRAAGMGGLYVIATVLGRRSTALVSLAVACWAMTLANPLALWDVGFQLSSAATAGLILFTPAITAAFSRILPNAGSTLTQSSSLPITNSPVINLSGSAERAKSLLRGLIEDGLIVTIAANITTMPLVVFYFGRLSIVSLLSNLAIAPVQPFIMLWGSASILLGATDLPGLTHLARLLLAVPWLSLVWTVAAVRGTAVLPGASLEIASYGLGALALTYGLVGLLRWRPRPWPRRLNFGMAQFSFARRLLGTTTAGVLGIGCVLIWSLALTQPDGRLHLWFLDIGQGDGVLVQTPSGRQLLIDGGESPQLLLSELGAALPFWDRSLDLLLLTHPDGDHMLAQIDVPARFAIAQAIAAPTTLSHPDSERWLAAMAEQGVEVRAQSMGGWIDLGDGVGLWLLWPEAAGYIGPDADNENSLVAKLVYGDFSVLLTGDAGVPSEVEWLATGAPLASTVLKVGHHGSDTSTSAEFLRAVAPSLAVIQVGAENRYGHPTTDVMERLEDIETLRTDQHGRIHVWSDGEQMWVEAEVGE